MKSYSAGRRAFTLLLSSFLTLASCQLQFIGNTGSVSGVYQFSHDENNDTRGGQLPLPAGQFIVECNLNGMSSSNISYSLPSDGNGVFRINTNTGELALQGAGRLDYETTRSYVLNAACNISSDPSIPTAVVQINFNIRPVNEFKPEIVLDSSALTRRNLVLLNEFSEVGEVVAIRLTGTVTEPSPNSFGYSIVDRDEGETETLSFMTSSTFDEGNFRIDEATGTITLSKKLDFDGSANPSLSTIDIQVCNSLPPTGISCGNLVIRVGLTWSNDNSPTFSQESYMEEIPEGLPPGGLVANVSCTDGDRFIGERMNVVSSSNFFNVSYVQERDYQLVYSTAPLDYEVVQSLSTVLTCSDNLGLTAKANLSVQVLPLNDNRPYFPRSSYLFQVNRLLTLGSQIGSVQAIDNDLNVGNSLTYTLTNSTNFQVESDGTIILSDFVYIIEGQTFQLQVSVSDGEFNSTAQVSITMTGVISIPEIILICMGSLIFIVLVIFIVVCCCYLSVCCSRLLPEKRSKLPPEMLGDDNPDALYLQPVIMHPMGNMYQQAGAGHNYMLGKVPTETEDNYDKSYGNPSDTDFDEQDKHSIRTESSNLYKPSSNLGEMVDLYYKGENILGKKSKKSAS